MDTFFLRFTKRHDSIPELTLAKKVHFRWLCGIAPLLFIVGLPLIKEFVDVPLETERYQLETLTQEIWLSASKHYVAYHDFSSVGPAHEYYSTEPDTGIRFSLRKSKSDVLVPIERPSKTIINKDKQGYYGIAIGMFHIDEAGTYILTVRESADRTAAPLVISFLHPHATLWYFAIFLSLWASSWFCAGLIVNGLIKRGVIMVRYRKVLFPYKDF